MWNLLSLIWLVVWNWFISVHEIFNLVSNSIFPCKYYKIRTACMPCCTSYLLKQYMITVLSIPTKIKYTFFIYCKIIYIMCKGQDGSIKAGLQVVSKVEKVWSVPDIHFIFWSWLCKFDYTYIICWKLRSEKYCQQDLLIHTNTFLNLKVKMLNSKRGFIGLHVLHYHISNLTSGFLTNYVKQYHKFITVSCMLR